MQRKPVVCVGMMTVIAAVIFWALAVSIVTRGAKIAFSQDLANQISIGMTRTEVEAILRCPPGDYTTGPYDTGPGSSWGLVCDWWISDTGEIGVWFDKEGKVRKVIFRPVEREPFINRWYRWAGW